MTSSVALTKAKQRKRAIGYFNASLSRDYGLGLPPDVLESIFAPPLDVEAVATRCVQAYAESRKGTVASDVVAIYRGEAAKLIAALAVIESEDAESVMTRFNETLAREVGLQVPPDALPGIFAAPLDATAVAERCMRARGFTRGGEPGAYTLYLGYSTAVVLQLLALER